MRWRLQPPPKIGDTREVTKFLLWPKTIRGEWRWLERAKWQEKLTPCVGFHRYGPFNDSEWVSDCWIDAPLFEVPKEKS